MRGLVRRESVERPIKYYSSVNPTTTNDELWTAAGGSLSFETLSTFRGPDYLCALVPP